MKRQLLTLILCLCGLYTFAQNHKFGVVDMDSVLQSFPEVRELNHQIDSIRIATLTTIEPLQSQLREKMFLAELLSPNDTIQLKELNGDAELLYQEMSLLQQKGSRAINQLMQSGKPYTEKVNQAIRELAEKNDIIFVIPKRKILVNPGLGFPFEMLMDSPLYFEGDVIDMTPLLINYLNPPKLKKNKK